MRAITGRESLRSFAGWLKDEVADGWDRKLAASRAAILSTQPGATQCYPCGSCFGSDIDAQHWPFSESPEQVRKQAQAITGWGIA